MTVDPAQVTIPSQRNDVDEQNSVMQRNKLEVDHLNERPNHPIALQCRPVALLQLVLRTCTLHYSHTAEEAEQVGTGEDGLIGGYSGQDFGVLVS